MTEPAHSAREASDECAYCGGDGEVVIRFVFGFQVQDCPECHGAGVQHGT